MHIVYAGIRKTAWIFLLVPVLACILQMSAVMAFASASLETDRRTGVEIATAGNASADRTIVETATVSDAEKLTKPREEASEESERDLTEEPLLDDLSPIASVSNAEYQPALCAPQISVVVPTQMLFVIEMMLSFWRAMFLYRSDYFASVSFMIFGFYLSGWWFLC